ncbi:kinase-like domain-containing protein [Phakopsora pachyrhizi]|nr:kinase-like domain-containing protein [Phakopsora pachyrhizi]
MQNLVESSEQALTLAKSSDIDLPLTIKMLSHLSISTLSLRKWRVSNQSVVSSLPDLYISVQVWSDNRPLTLPLYTPHKQFTSSLTWSTPITLPIKYRDLPHSSQLTFNIFNVTDYSSTSSTGSGSGTITDDFLLDRSLVVGGTTISLFGKKRTLRTGKQRCLIHRDQLADGRVHTTTPNKLPLNPDQSIDKLGKLEKLVKKHERGDLPRLEWLDQCTFRQIEKIHAQETAKSPYIFLYIDLPKFDFPIVYSECEFPAPSLPQVLSALPPQPNLPQNHYATQSLNHLFTVIDPEMVNDNPIENKHTRLHRSHRNGPLDRELRPEKSVRDALNKILSYPPTRVLTRDERDLLWRFRFYLSHDKRALTKFLKSVVWSDKGEVRQAIEDLLPNWAEISLDDALELLGPSDDFRDPRLKRFAVQQLARAEDDELVLYLLQLVQALKFDISSSFNRNESPGSKSALDPIHIRQRRFSSATSKTQIGVSDNNNNRNDLFSSDYRSARSDMPARINELEETTRRSRPLSLEDFLIERACLNPVVLGYQFYWYLTVEEGAGGDKGVCMMYSRVLKKFYDKMQETDEGREMADVIQRQRTFVNSLSKLAYEIRTSKDARPKKIEKLRQILKDTAKLASIFSAESVGSIVPLPLPLDPTKLIVGIDGEKSTVFKSNMFPLRLVLRCNDGSEYPILAKNGDDLRQDQLVIQLINLMDRLLKKENLDLRLTPYKVLATSKEDGLVQLIGSKSLGEVLSEYGGGILEYLRIENSTSNKSSSKYGVKMSVMDNFVRSCAGYCVVTYILGVGDRHLDNLLLTPDGHFFHVDFGYILGRDPKPFPPTIKLSKEMIEAMGGNQSRLYSKFKRLCFIGYLNLRKSNGLMINLIELMIDGNIPDIILEPDKAVMKVQEKFKLNLTEEDEVIKEFEKELSDTSYFTLVFDKIHAVAQHWRA